MGKHPEKALSPAKIRSLKDPGYYSDGNCLYLQVSEAGSKSWIVRVTIKGKRREIGVGSLRYVSLAEARDEAIEIRKAARTGGDPLTDRQQQKQAADRERGIPTFEAAARAVHADLAGSFRNEKHSRNWIVSMEQYVFPRIGDRRVDEIQTADILKVLTPIWQRIPDTAKRTKQRVNAVLDWSRAAGHRTGDNPVDGIERVLPKHKKKDNHYVALPWAEVPAFVRALRTDAGVSGRLAFEFMILTAARTGEIIKATWDEIDLGAKMWTRPADHMKAHREHRIPLASRCLQILDEAKSISDGSQFIFPGMRTGRPLSNMVFHATLRRMGRSGSFTPHGFRSSFRDWSEEKTNHARRTIEASLAHELKDKVEAAYLRSELLDKRRDLMTAWADYVTRDPKAKVVRMAR
jgi:integrase